MSRWNLAEKSKIEKYAQLCDTRGIKLLPAAFNAYGGWGTVVLRDLVEPHFDKLRAEERAETSQEWDTLRERELLFQQVSVTIAQGNSMIFGTMDHDRRNCDVAAKRDTASLAALCGRVIGSRLMYRMCWGACPKQPTADPRSDPR